jgi:hypothetical protein
MSLARHNFAKIVPTDKSKLGSRVYSPSQITNMIKANANTAQPKRFAFGISAFYRVNSGAINDYRTITGIRAVESDAIPNGALLDGNDGASPLILEGNGGGSEIVLDGN